MPNDRLAAEQAQQLAVIESTVKRERSRLKTLLPASIPPARAIETVVAAARKTPALLECTPESFAFALRESARWGLIPDGVMGQGYLIPRRNGTTGLMEAHFQAGYRGLEELARRSGVVASIISGWHCQRDPDFSIRLGFDGDIRHTPALTGRGDIVGFYAGAWLTNGAPPVVAYMEAAEVIAIRDAVPYWSKGPWASHFAMMGRKTVVRRLMTMLPLSADIQAIIGVDEDGAYDRPPARNVTPEQAEPNGHTGAAESARAAIRGRRGTPAPAPEPGPTPEPAEPPAEQVTGVVRLPDVAGLNGVATETPSGPVVGFRLDVGDEWLQVILSGGIQERYRVAAGENIDRTLTDGDTVTVVGQRVIIPREGKDPVVRIIATEDIQWPST